MLLSISSIINAQNISPDILLSDGQIVNTSHIFLDKENPTFSLDQSDFVADWQFHLYTSADKSESILISQSESSSNKFTLDFVNTLTRDGITSKLHQFSNGMDNSIYFIGFVQISSDKTILEKIDISLNLLPSKPILSNISYEYKYNWDFDMMDYGNLSVTVSSNRTSGKFLAKATVDTFCFEFPTTGRWYGTEFAKNSSSDNSAIFFTDWAEWGTYYWFETYNQYGYAVSDMILTTDYITDPDILNRLEEIKNSRSEQPEIIISNDITFNTSQNTISIIGDKSAISDITICDIQGRVLYTQNSNDDIDISSLNKGLYILLYTDSAGHKYSTKFQKK